MRQLSMFPTPKPEYGGESALGKRKTRRPLSCGRPLHLVLKARRSIYASDSGIIYHLRRLSGRFRVKVYDTAVADDHIHLVLRIPSRDSYVKYIRSVTGILARKLGTKLWFLLPYTRVVNWGRDLAGLLRYLNQNREEAAGRRAYVPRKVRKNKSDP